ncbi:MAG TPA: aldo/keto reductase [Candidatus Binataceae bacterium]|nr:aldo/keto reductase [Candidatus Binataceae bacterium]
MIEKIAFGNTGHQSTRIIFGAAALGAMNQAKADAVLETLLEYGVNHIDTAASYGESELRIGPWMREHRKRFFLASKTGDRTFAGARASLHRSLERLRVDSLDLIQMHNLVDEKEWDTALGAGGALEALAEARAQGLVRFIGVTGHGTRVAAMHRRSLERFPFDSVLFPYNFTMLSIAQYAADAEALIGICRERGVATQTIKSAARRRWQDSKDPQIPQERKYSWYQPLRERDAIRRAVHFTLSRPGLFLNSSSDATILRDILDAASEAIVAPSRAAMEADVATYAMEPLFIPGVSDTI